MRGNSWVFRPTTPGTRITRLRNQWLPPCVASWMCPSILMNTTTSLVRKLLTYKVEIEAKR